MYTLVLFGKQRIKSRILKASSIATTASQAHTYIHMYVKSPGFWTRGLRSIVTQNHKNEAQIQKLV